MGVELWVEVRIITAPATSADPLYTTTPRNRIQKLFLRMGAGFNNIENKNNIKIRNVSNSRLNGLSSWFGVDHLGARGCCSLGYRL